MFTFPVVFVIGLSAFATCSLGQRHNNNNNKNIHNNRDLFLMLKDVLRDGVSKEKDLESTASREHTFLEEFNQQYKLRAHQVELASFTYLTDINEENKNKLTDVQSSFDDWMSTELQIARHFIKDLDQFTTEDDKRMLSLIVDGHLASQDQTVNEQLNQLSSQLEEIYATATCAGKPLEPDLETIMSTSRNYNELLEAWLCWRNVTGPYMRPLFETRVQLSNQVAMEGGFSDMSEFWMRRDFEDSDVEQVADELYLEILPLYTQLHSYVRRKLKQTYPEANIQDNGMIPAHLLGNMWAQEWGNIYDLVKPYPEVHESDVTEALVEKGYSPERMFRLAEDFFVSLGLPHMTDVFWEKSMLTRPSDRQVECHASASDLFAKDDFRIKMCTSVTEDSLVTIHHEMGHIQYYMAYQHRPTLYRSGANAAFHEAIGDTIALAVDTPTHYERIGLLKPLSSGPEDAVVMEPNITKKEINSLMKMALDKVAFLPFGYLIDKYRWHIFNRDIQEPVYNTAWWHLRNMYQGLEAPVERSEEYFDPGAKYHVAADVPYMRYFFSFIAQFQFHGAMCRAAKHYDVIHRCDFYQSKDAGHLLENMLSLGASQPWPQAMKIMTGQKNIKTDAIWTYFRPLYNWLVQQNKAEVQGWGYP